MHATEIEPDYLRANSLIACMRTARALLGIVDPTANLAAAQEMADHAIQRDPIDPSTHFAAGFSSMVARRFDQAVEALSEAMSLNPSLAIAHTILESTYGYGALPRDGMHHLAIAERPKRRTCP